MITTLGAVFGLLCAAMFALAGPMLTLHDRLPERHRTRPAPPFTKIASPDGAFVPGQDAAPGDQKVRRCVSMTPALAPSAHAATHLASPVWADSFPSAMRDLRHTAEVPTTERPTSDGRASHMPGSPSAPGGFHTRRRTWRVESGSRSQA